MSIIGNVVGGSAPLKTVILTDGNGNEITGVVVDQEVLFTATDNDVREGMVYASNDGVSTGTKDIPSYRTQRGAYMVSAGEDFKLSLIDKYNTYDYTQLQCIITIFDTAPDNSVASDKIVLGDHVYATNSSEVLSTVSKDNENKLINLNITNDTDNDYIVHYFTYREEA